MSRLVSIIVRPLNSASGDEFRVDPDWAERLAIVLQDSCAEFSLALRHAAMVARRATPEGPGPA